MNNKHSILMSEETITFLRSRLSKCGMGTLLEHVAPDTNEYSSVTTSFVVSFAAEEQAKIIDCLLDLFSSEGIDLNGEPNYLGTYIESLIDVFSQCDV